MNKIFFFLSASILITGCVNNTRFTTEQAIATGSGILQAVTLDETKIKQTATLAAQKMDASNQVPVTNNKYAQRLASITHGLQQYDGLNLNFKVYMSNDINAFAMADGTIRVYAGLLDAMPDDQVLAVIGHEIGHIKLKHTYNQMREKILTDTAFKSAISIGGTFGELTGSQLGQLAKAAVDARFSQSDELESDVYAVQQLKTMGKDPNSMLRAIETLQKKMGSKGNFLSSHPSNAKRINKIKETISKL